MNQLPFDENGSEGSLWGSKSGGSGGMRGAKKKVTRRSATSKSAQNKPKSKASGAGEPLTVSQVSGQIKHALTNHFPAKIRILGEVSNLSNRQHWFFSLKDEGAAIRCVCFASNARRINFPVKDGLQVVATGRVDYYDAQGSVQIYVEKMEPVGLGNLELELRARMEELRQLGYFDPARKKALPEMPRRIAVVTSRAAAALQDVINTTKRRWPACQLLLADVRVQGELAAPEIARAIRKISADYREFGIDAIILTRGGGSIEDLWAFNERIVADAVYACNLPVVAAIGHETDTTIAELVADHRCSTPTQAAMMLVPDGRAMWQQIRQLEDRLKLLTERVARNDADRLRHVIRHPLFRSPDGLLREKEMQLGHLETRLLPMLQNRLNNEKAKLQHHETRLKPICSQRLQRAGMALDRIDERLQSYLPREVTQLQQRLDSMQRHLESVGPKSVLARGFSYTTDDDGQLVRSINDATPGKRITTHVADGEFESVIDGTPEQGTVKPKKVHKKKVVKKKLQNDKSDTGFLF
ncbi:exodeoxyribonuclease VII large subunit [Planctomycetota bacterium]|nr:exodeoxyribonuclease VII large subunit [Planctomycetota bacterium]